LVTSKARDQPSRQTRQFVVQGFVTGQTIPLVRDSERFA
jgi:hypothetical protein